MQWQAFISTFLMLLVAEMGDKTQLAVMMQSANFQKPWAVLAGAALALTIVSALGVCVGQVCAVYLKPEIIRYVAGSLFVIMGALMLFGVMGGK
ncbi:MAG: TMEM165/GDT1 family protein [Armatimonadia bacterium]